MGGDSIVPGITEEELRLEAMRAVGREGLPVLGREEFAVGDWARLFGIGVNKAKRELDFLVRAGTIQTAPRYDVRTGRRVNGYWKVKK